MDFQIQITEKELFRFNLRHNYLSVQGVIGVVLSLLALFLAIRYFDPADGLRMALLIVVGLYYPLLLPLILYNRSRAAAKNTPTYQAPFLYHFGEESFTVAQGDATAEFFYKNMRRVRETGKDLTVYSDRVHAHILPKDQLGGRADALASLLKEKIGGRR